MLVNVMFKSDANRGLAEECGVALPTIAVMDAVQEEGALVQVSTVSVLVLRAERVGWLPASRRLQWLFVGYE